MTPHLGQTLDLLDAKREQLLGLCLGADPVLWRLQVPAALLAPKHRHLLLYPLGDVNLGTDAVDTHVAGVGLDACATQAAQHVALCGLGRESLHGCRLAVRRRHIKT